jgi:SAM-dependent methyltransferase
MCNQILSPILVQFLACPTCQGEIEFSNRLVRCLSCGAGFPQVADDWIDLLPSQQPDEKTKLWQERLIDMESWYNDLIANPKAASACLLSDYTPYSPFLADLSGDILDIGGGIGLPRNHLPSNTNYIVLDPSLEWLKTDWSILSESFPCLANKPNFVRGVGESLPFLSESFDAVLSFWSLNHTSDPQMVFSEITRVLRPGGKILVVLEEMVPQWLDLVNPRFPARAIFNSFFNLGSLPRHFPRLRLFFRLLNRGDWPLQADHIRIRELEIQDWIRQNYVITQRVWVNHYLTFEMRKR